ncbi:NADP-dependent malic enzyme [Lachnospiraceae bacterium 54-53]
MDYGAESLELHRKWKGKLEMQNRVPLQTMEDLALAYTPGVAQPCLEIKKDVNQSYELTRRWNTVAVITDGTAVLGLGDIGPEAGMPVMEGKCVLFKCFGGVDAVPLCIRSRDIDEIVRTVQLISGSFGGINLEDISAPRCFEIERRLRESCDIPVFHDDQHGTAIVVSAALINALKLVGKKFDELRVVLNGPGAAGTAIIHMLVNLGVKDIIAVDEYGILEEARAAGLSGYKKELAMITNPRRLRGGLQEAVKNSDVFIGTSVPGCFTEKMVQSMNVAPIIFACANPVPEILPDQAKRGGAAVVCTGRSDYPNQVNNVLAFPGVFRGVLDVRASEVTEGMKIAAAYALAGLVDGTELSSDYILPNALEKKVVTRVADGVRKAAIQEGVARIQSLPGL